MRCDRIYNTVCITIYYSFNPLWVFQCAATFLRNIVYGRCYLVSIPYGFSNALRREFWQKQGTVVQGFQSLMGFPMRCDIIYKRFYRGVHTKFQSLMGFPMRCDILESSYSYSRSRQVSIPYGFSNALRLTHSDFAFHELLVSIPYGFSNALRRPEALTRSAAHSSFNPLWVFQCAATKYRKR